ncbi:hypothetical protein TrST_g13966 [Triparma strigata]|uniref:B9 domain-containing protein 2 n=1 Tax=Triparma strigata TaxID=1606541 RepID=A0A9W7EPP3_9STRA|nr:hypothetical protein TrST_g13966 [Triparma strigata]
MSKSLSALRNKSKKKAKDDSEDDESKNEEPTDTSPSKKLGGFLSGMKNRAKGKSAKDDEDNSDSDGETPKKKGMGGLFGKKSLFGNKDKNKDKDGSDDDDDDESPKKTTKKKSKDDSDSDDEEKDEDDENQDSSNSPRRGGGKKKKKKKKKGRRGEDSDEEEEEDENVAAVSSNVQNQAFMRRQPKAKLEKRLRERVRVVADMTPEVHFMGEVIGGVGFGPGTSCKFTIEFGKNWDLLSGEFLGQSQYGYNDGFAEEMISWNHPIDLHMATSSMQGWPRIRFQVWELDEYGRTNLSGYGFVHLPTNAGNYEIMVPCWRPTGSLPEEIQSFFLGTNPQLTNETVLFSKAWENRCRLVTIPSGKIWLNISVIHRFFAQQNIDLPGNS